MVRSILFEEGSSMRSIQEQQKDNHIFLTNELRDVSMEPLNVIPKTLKVGMSLMRQAVY